ncbi:hypothetical protein [Massilia aquatica]|uniref:Secreted protein n=1 Tax=Massilia aquatica TaxID=2609000 RepID=A0ABX0MA53_9BURK|nr:hypothetical protein [Massilia aquatica]NHZ43887.1 hypothetical protein [Massilia aquatica]
MRALSTFFTKAVLTCALAALSQASAATDATMANGGRLLAFIGQKVGLTEQARPQCEHCIITNAHYLATYRVLDTVFGSYRDALITFDVYDHFGEPAFSRYDNVLLFVSLQEDGTWLHEKYQFFDVHRGSDGQWYGCGDPYQTTRKVKRTVHARPVQFLEPVSYALDGLDPELVERRYPAAYFEIRDGRAHCLLATPAHDLFQAKKETVLAARGIFK